MAHIFPVNLRCAALLFATATTAAAQSFNIDVGIGFGTPASTYGGAAGQPGVWNEIDMGLAQGTPFPLADVSGAATGVTLFYTNSGDGNFSFDNPSTSGDDEALLDDLVDVGKNADDRVVFIVRGLATGTYDVYVDSWRPDSTGFLSQIRVGPGGAGLQTCGGAPWSGSHVAGQTYVTDTVTTTNGDLGVIVSVHTVGDFASCNGIQLVDRTCGGAGVNYCTAGTSSDGCTATMAISGTPSATATSGFDLMVFGANGNKDLLFIWGWNGRQANTWGTSSSYLCVVPPVIRGGLLLPHTGTTGNCDQDHMQDLNALWCPSCPRPAKNPGAGATAQAQAWYRDPFSTSNQTTALSDAIEFTVCP